MSSDRRYRPDMSDYIENIRYNREQLEQYVYKQSRQINQRYYRLEKAGLEKESPSYHFSQVETGKQKPRYTQSKNKIHEMTDNELYRRSLDLNKKLSSYSTVPDVKDLVERRIKGSHKKLEEKLKQSAIENEENKQAYEDFSKYVTEDIWNKFSKKGGRWLFSQLKKYLDSYQIISMMGYHLSQKGTLKDFIDSMKKFLKEAEKMENAEANKKAFDMFDDILTKKRESQAKKAEKRKSKK